MFSGFSLLCVSFKVRTFPSIGCKQCLPGFKSFVRLEIERIVDMIVSIFHKSDHLIDWTSIPQI